MSNILSDLASGFGRGIGALGSLGTSEFFIAQKEKERLAQQQALQQQQQAAQELANIQSGQSIPAFARPGGAEPETPEQIRQTQLLQLGALAPRSPGAAQLLGQLSPLAPERPGTVAPSAVREFEFFNDLSPKQQQKFLAVKRTDPLRGKGLSESPTGEVTIKPGFASSVKEIAKQQQIGRLEARREVEPSVAAAINAAKIVGTQRGTKKVELAERLAGFPRLEKVARELSELGKVATFTKVGQARDAFLRETGQELGEAGIARSQYIAKIDNEILPLLRQTFGSQFTETEGQSLKATLGDVNKSSAEKDAILQSFMDAKIGQIESLQRELGAEEVIPTGQSINTQGEGTIATNPQTGQRVILRGGQWQPL